MRALIGQQGLATRHEESGCLRPKSQLAHFPRAETQSYPNLLMSFCLSNKDLCLIGRSNNSFYLDIFNVSWESSSHIELCSHVPSPPRGARVFRGQYSGISHRELPQNNTKKLQTLLLSNVIEMSLPWMRCRSLLLPCYRLCGWPRTGGYKQPLFIRNSRSCHYSHVSQEAVQVTCYTTALHFVNDIRVCLFSEQHESEKVYYKACSVKGGRCVTELNFYALRKVLRWASHRWHVSITSIMLRIRFYVFKWDWHGCGRGRHSWIWQILAGASRSWGSLLCCWGHSFALFGCVQIESHLILRYLYVATEKQELEMVNGDDDAEFVFITKHGRVLSDNTRHSTIVPKTVSALELSFRECCSRGSI